MRDITGGLVAILAGPVQLWLGMADRGRAWHRRMGGRILISSRFVSQPLRLAI